MNEIFITDSLRHKFDRISDFKVTVLEAPKGYGKSAALLSYIKQTNKKASFLNIIQNAVDLIFEDVFTAIVENSSYYDVEKMKLCEHNHEDIRAFRYFLKTLVFNEEVYIVINNIQYVDNEVIFKYLELINNFTSQNLKIILISSEKYSTRIYERIIMHDFLLIDIKDFVFKPADIADYLEYKELRMSPENINKIYTITNGWLLAIDVLLNSYIQTGTLDDNRIFVQFVESLLWDKLTESEKSTLVVMSMLEKFSDSQVKILEKSNSKVDFNKILSSNPFIIYDSLTRQYVIHNILLDYLHSEFDNYSIRDKQKVYLSTATIFESMGDIFRALESYYYAHEFNHIVNMSINMADIYHHVNSKNKEFFLSLIKDMPDDIEIHNYDFLMLMCMVLFMYNDRENMMLLYNKVQKSIENNTFFNENEKDFLFGRLSYVRGFIEFNDIEYMTDKYMNAINLLEGSTTGMIEKTPWNYGVPSILHLYHRNMGELNNEVEKLERCMPFYYRISNGHGKGGEAVFAAETLFMTGEFKSAEILCHKASYMADTRMQGSISACALLILAKMAVCKGDYDDYMRRLNEFADKIKEENLNVLIQNNIIDFCQSAMHIILGDSERVADWLKDWNSIEHNTNIISRSYANIIYGKYLILTEQYERLIGISGQFLGSAAIFENILPKIYTYIYIAIANKCIGENDKAIKMLRIAFDFAVDDCLIMPFVENDSYIEDIYSNIAFDQEYRWFLKKIKSISKDFTQGIKSIKKNFKNRDNYGLTAREYDVAKLAAERLSNKEIADRLFIAESTVKSNMKVIFNKLGISSRSELVDLF